MLIKRNVGDTSVELLKKDALTGDGSKLEKCNDYIEPLKLCIKNCHLIIMLSLFLK
jgi:hypothetical protein